MCLASAVVAICLGLNIDDVTLVLKGANLCMVENEALASLSSKASDRLQLAFRPKTRKAYSTMFRTFIAFCIVTKSCIVNVNIQSSSASNLIGQIIMVTPEIIMDTQRKSY